MPNEHVRSTSRMIECRGTKVPSINLLRCHFASGSDALANKRLAFEDVKLRSESRVSHVRGSSWCWGPPSHERDLPTYKGCYN